MPDYYNNTLTAETVELDEFGAISTREVDTNTVDIPARLRAALGMTVLEFAAKKKTAKKELTMPSAEAAELLRAQIKEYAREFGLLVSLPKKNKFGPLNNGAVVTFRIAERTEDDDAQDDDGTGEDAG